MHSAQTRFFIEGVLVFLKVLGVLWVEIRCLRSSQMCMSAYIICLVEKWWRILNLLLRSASLCIFLSLEVDEIVVSAGEVDSCWFLRTENLWINAKDLV